MKKLIEEPDTVSVTVSTYKNMDNLAASFKKVMLSKYEGTRLGKQELHGEILDDIQGALWSYSMIEPNRVRWNEVATSDGLDTITAPTITYKDMEKIIVAIDPAGTSSKKRDETGIVVVGKLGDHFYVLDDVSGHFTPEGWAKEAWRVFDKYEADKIVAEKNYGGEMVLSTLRNSRKGGPVDLVTSRRGKKLRAEPIVSLYEQNRVHHMTQFEDLETQMTEWVPDTDPDSPDRVDALVHGLTKLNGGAEHSAIASPTGQTVKGKKPARRGALSRVLGYRGRAA
jgi:phage terminase large subunit-like protein